MFLQGRRVHGKTLIIDSLQILAGGRFSKEMIRTGQDFSFVELSLNLEGIDDSIIISREININGKNICKINGRMSTVNELKEYMKDIIDIHGQHDNQSILEPQMHINYLDLFGGKNIIFLKNEYKEKYNTWCNLRQELKNNYGDEKERQRKLDLLKYQLNEIESAMLKKGEDVELENTHKIIMNSESLLENLNSASYQLTNVVLDAFVTSKRNIEKIENVEPKYKELSDRLNEVYYNIEEIARDISHERK